MYPWLPRFEHTTFSSVLPRLKIQQGPASSKGHGGVGEGQVSIPRKRPLLMKSNRFPTPCNNLTPPPPRMCRVSHRKESEKHAARAQPVSTWLPAQLCVEATSKEPPALRGRAHRHPARHRSCHLQILQPTSKEVSSNSSFSSGLSPFGLFGALLKVLLQLPVVGSPVC